MQPFANTLVDARPDRSAAEGGARAAVAARRIDAAVPEARRLGRVLVHVRPDRRRRLAHRRDVPERCAGHARPDDPRGDELVPRGRR